MSSSSEDETRDDENGDYDERDVSTTVRRQVSSPTLAEKREIRESIDRNRERVAGVRDKPVDEAFADLSSCLFEAHDRGKTKNLQLSEHACDSHLLLQLATAVTQKEFASKFALYLRRSARNSARGSDTDDEDERPSTSTPAAKKRFTIADEAWINFGKECTPLFNEAPVFTYIHGAFEPGEVVQVVPERRARQRKLDDAPETLVTSLRLDETAATLDDAIDALSKATFAQAEALLKILKQYGEYGVDFFEFVLHPSKFEKTVEIMFACSFLVKEGRASIRVEDGLPFIAAVSADDAAAAREEGDTSQTIFELDMKQWRELVDVYEITEPLVSEEVMRAALGKGH